MVLHVVPFLHILCAFAVILHHIMCDVKCFSKNITLFVWCVVFAHIVW